MIHTQASIPELERKVESLVMMLAGVVPDPSGQLHAFWLAVGFAALADIKSAFVTKARGGTDAMGITWPKLSPVTIARRKVGAADRKLPWVGAQLREREKIVKREYNKLFPQYAMVMPEEHAHKEANRVAGLRATNQTGVSRVDILGYRDVEILRDTGALLNSFSPGTLVGATYTPPPGDGAQYQVMKPIAGGVIVGSNLFYANIHQKGTDRIPQRKILPDSMEEVPETWAENWIDAGLRSFEVILETAL